MPIVSAARGGVVGSGGGSLSPQAAAIADGTSGANMAVEALGLLNNAGTFNRQREYSGAPPSGQAWVNDQTLQSLVSSMIVLMRAMLLMQNVTNTLLGGSSIDFKPDLMAVSDLINLATPPLVTPVQTTPAVNPNTLQ